MNKLLLRGVPSIIAIKAFGVRAFEEKTPEEKKLPPEMVSTKRLSKEEKIRMAAHLYTNCRWTMREIGLAMGKTESAISHLLRNEPIVNLDPKTGPKFRKRGRPQGSRKPRPTLRKGCYDD